MFTENLLYLFVSFGEQINIQVVMHCISLLGNFLWFVSMFLSPHVHPGYVFLKSSKVSPPKSFPHTLRNWAIM